MLYTGEENSSFHPLVIFYKEEQNLTYLITSYKKEITLVLNSSKLTAQHFISVLNWVS